MVSIGFVHYLVFALLLILYVRFITIIYALLFILYVRFLAAFFAVLLPSFCRLFTVIDSETVQR